jgi:outer membrane lipoprotein SlyB
MIKQLVSGLMAVVVVTWAVEAMARGAVSGGVRGAMVGGMVGGSAGAANGAKIGAVAGATQGVAQRAQDRGAMDAETQARVQYEATPAYRTQNAELSNFNEAPPNVMVTTPSAASTTVAPATATAAPATPATGAPAAGGEAVVRQGGKPEVAITYPADWKQQVGDNFVTAVSPDGHVWSVIATLPGVKDQRTGIDRIKQQLDKYLKDIDYDDPTETKRGAMLITGTGKSKKSGADLVFAAGVFDTGAGQLAGTAFVVDKNMEDHYKETVRYTCQTIRGAQDLANRESPPRR